MPPGSTGTIVEGGAAFRSASPPHRRDAAALIRQLGGRTEAAVRRELDRLFARPPRPDRHRARGDRPGHVPLPQPAPPPPAEHPPRGRRAGDPADPHPLLDAARRLFGLADAPPANQVDPRRPGDRRLAESLV